MRHFHSILKRAEGVRGDRGGVGEAYIKCRHIYAPQLELFNEGDEVPDFKAMMLPSTGNLSTGNLSTRAIRRHPILRSGNSAVDRATAMQKSLPTYPEKSPESTLPTRLLISVALAEFI